MNIVQQQFPCYADILLLLVCRHFSLPIGDANRGCLQRENRIAHPLQTVFTRASMHRSRLPRHKRSNLGLLLPDEILKAITLWIAQ